MSTESRPFHQLKISCLQSVYKLNLYMAKTRYLRGFFDGGGGIRTPVRRPRCMDIYGCSRRFAIHRQARAAARSPTGQPAICFAGGPRATATTIPLWLRLYVFMGERRRDGAADCDQAARARLERVKVLRLVFAVAFACVINVCAAPRPAVHARTIPVESRTPPCRSRHSFGASNILPQDRPPQKM